MQGDAREEDEIEEEQDGGEEDGEVEDIGEGADRPTTFGLFPVVDVPIQTRLLEACRALLQRATPQQVHDLAYLIYALQRLPLATPGVRGGIDLATRYKESAALRHFMIAPDELALSSGESVDLGCGMDHASYPVLNVGTEAMREFGYGEDFSEWLSAFCDQAAEEETEVEVWCDADEEVDLTENAESIPWEENPLLDEMEW